VFAQPLDISKTGFLSVLDEVVRSLSADPPNLCGSEPCETVPGDPPEKLHSPARLEVIAEGRHHHATSVRGRRVEVDLLPTQSIFFSIHSWSIPFYRPPCELFGIVFRKECIRLIQGTIAGPVLPPFDAPIAYHTALPLAEPGTHVLRALNQLAEEGNNGPPARDLFVSLIHLVRRQLVEDVPLDPAHHRAQHTWQAVRHYLDDNFGRDVTRESVAEAFNLHPNYLSALARQSIGQSFRQVLEMIRMDQARRLVRDTDLKLARIATLCGYGSALRFGKVFHRVFGITPSRFRNESKNPT
jgi:AraC-like DNA-binding protein